VQTIRANLSRSLGQLRLNIDSSNVMNYVCRYGCQTFEHCIRELAMIKTRLLKTSLLLLRVIILSFHLNHTEKGGEDKEELSGVIKMSKDPVNPFELNNIIE